MNIPGNNSNWALDITPRQKEDAFKKLYDSAHVVCTAVNLSDYTNSWPTAKLAPYQREALSGLMNRRATGPLHTKRLYSTDVIHTCYKCHRRTNVLQDGLCPFCHTFKKEITLNTCAQCHRVAKYTKDGLCAFCYKLDEEAEEEVEELICTLYNDEPWRLVLFAISVVAALAFCLYGLLS